MKSRIVTFIAFAFVGFVFGDLVRDTFWSLSDDSENSYNQRYCGVCYGAESGWSVCSQCTYSHAGHPELIITDEDCDPGFCLDHSRGYLALYDEDCASPPVIDDLEQRCDKCIENEIGGICLDCADRWARGEP